jgi:hypothetical protein
VKEKIMIHKKMCFFGILLVCGFLLTSVDDCESWYLVEQEQASRLEQAEQERARQERLQQEERAKQEQATLANRQGASQGSSTSQSGGTSQSQTGTGTAAQGQSTQSPNQADSQTNQSQSTAAVPNQSSTQGTSQSQNQGGATQAQGTQAQEAQGTPSQGSAAQGASQTPQGGAAAVPSQAAPEASENTAPAGSTGASYLSTITGKEWKLSEVRLPGKTMLIDRNKLNADKMGDLFTFTVDNSRISGKAAPNRYTSMYQAGANNTLTIQPPISTLMASIYDPERIREREYFQYISRVKSWKLNQGKLELYTTDASNKEVVLVYVN